MSIIMPDLIGAIIGLASCGVLVVLYRHAEMMADGNVGSE